MKLFLDTNVFVEFIEHRKQYESVSLIIDAILEEQHNSLLPQRNRRCHCPMSLNDEERRTLKTADGKGQPLFKHRRLVRPLRREAHRQTLSRTRKANQNLVKRIFNDII